MRRGQAALEFITTYGWALLVIMVMIGAIAYFGILNPSKFLPERCVTTPDFGCVDFRIDSSTQVVSLHLKQGVGKTIYYQSLNCSYTEAQNIPSVSGIIRIGDVNGPVQPAGASWPPRDAVYATCDFDSATPSTSIISQMKGQKMKINYRITYKLSSTGLDHTVDGEVFAEVQ
jgi:hypothetical protein